MISLPCWATKTLLKMSINLSVCEVQYHPTGITYSESKPELSRLVFFPVWFKSYIVLVFLLNHLSLVSQKGWVIPQRQSHIWARQTANAFNRLLTAMRHKSIKMPTKTAIYQAVLLSTLMYGPESWNTTVQEEKRLPAFYTRCLRKILGVPWQEHVPNEVIFERTSQVPLIIILRCKRRTCHPYAPSSIAAPLAPLEATRVPSLGNRTRWNDTVSRHLQDYELSLEEATVVTQDRKEWRSFVLALCELGPRYHQCNVL